MKITEKTKKKKIIKKMPNNFKFHCIEMYEKKKRKIRCLKENDETIFVYAPKSKRFGMRFGIDNFIENHDIIVDTNEEIDKKWHKQINRAINCLEKSGLWPDIKIYFENLSKMNYSDKKKIEEIYWSHWDKPEKEIQNEYKSYSEKYPFAFCFHEDKTIEPKIEYIFERSECKLKAMYFGKYQNSRIKAEIAEAIKNRKNYCKNAKTNYDVNFSFNAEKNMAWYAEEYRGCGNGHYYIALDENTALFCEND